MESKRDKSRRLIKANDDLISCPVCRELLHLNDDYNMTCSNSHNFDISKKGILNLVGKSNDRLYDKALFLNRRLVIKNGNYDPLIARLNELLTEYLPKPHGRLRILDMGCGEGSFLSAIGSNENTRIGIDLSKEGINLATDHDGDIIWLIDDLANIHMASDSFDVILNILSPANYNRFKRVLHDNGVIIKVIPGKDYLKEIRAALGSRQDKDVDNVTYDNTQTMEHTKKEMAVIHNENIKYKLDLSFDEFETFTGMTPLTNKKNVHIFKDSGNDGCREAMKKAYELTIDLEIFIGKPL